MKSYKIQIANHTMGTQAIVQYSPQQYYAATPTKCEVPAISGELIPMNCRSAFCGYPEEVLIRVSVKGRVQLCPTQKLSDLKI